jgi:hypothetical protein
LFSAAGALTSTEIEAMVAAATILISFCMAAFNFGEIQVSRFLPARFHAHLILSLARRAGIILHAGALLVTAHLAA